MEHWTGTHFEPAWLHQVGVEIHLGHQGRTCPSNNGGVNGVGSGSGVTAADGAEDGPRMVLIMKKIGMKKKKKKTKKKI